MPVERCFLYKDGKAELFDASEVEAKLAEGYTDAPGGMSAAAEEKAEEEAAGESEEPAPKKRRRRRRSKAEVERDKLLGEQLGIKGYRSDEHRNGACH